LNVPPIIFIYFKREKEREGEEESGRWSERAKERERERESIIFRYLIAGILQAGRELPY
jgi:hypothetical protein